MSDADELERIKREKAERLIEGEEGAEDEADDAPVHVEDEAHLTELVGSNDLVLVDFYADWCGPCRMLEPIVETIAADTPAAVAKVDVDEHQDLASEHGVRGVPTLVLYHDGEVAERMVGVQQQDRLRDLISQFA